MGSSLGKSFSAGVVHKLLPKRHNRMKGQLCGESATSPREEGISRRLDNKKGRAMPGLFLEFSET